nr:MAG TPA: hypothetical protein [Caudoviricetes sp.]
MGAASHTHNLSPNFLSPKNFIYFFLLNSVKFL